GTGACTPGLSAGSGVARWLPEASGLSTSQMIASPFSVLSTTGRSPGSLSAVTDDTKTPTPSPAEGGAVGRKAKNAAAASATQPPDRRQGAGQGAASPAEPPPPPRPPGHHPIRDPREVGLRHLDLGESTHRRAQAAHRPLDLPHARIRREGALHRLALRGGEL